MSGFCRFGGYDGAHGNCKETWETPSAIVTCVCPCHEERRRLAAIEAQRHIKRTIKAQPSRPIKRRLKPKK